MKYIRLTNDTITNNRTDIMGAFASGLCLVHCLATPFIFVAQACSSTCADAGPVWWKMIDYLFLAVSLAAVYYSARSTSLKWVPSLLYLSWGLLAFLVLNESFHLLPLNHALIYLPAFSLIGLHLYNKRYGRCEDDCCPTT